MKQNKLQIIYNFKAQEPQEDRGQGGDLLSPIPGLDIGGVQCQEIERQGKNYDTPDLHQILLQTEFMLLNVLVQI